MSDETGVGLARMARLQAIRARHRVLQKRIGVRVPVRPDEAAAIRGQVLSGVPIATVADRFGVPLSRVKRAAQEAWPELLDERAGLRRPHQEGTDRRCEACGSQYRVDWAGSPRRFCSRRCSASRPRTFRGRVKSAHHALTLQDGLGEADVARVVPEADLVGENAATARPRAHGASQAD